MLRVIEELAGDWRRLDQRIDGLSGEIEALARQDQACSRLMTVPGIGPIISSAMVAAIGTGDVFFFYEKNCPVHRPNWVKTAKVLERRQPARHALFASPRICPRSSGPPNLADIELHTSLARKKMSRARR